MTSLYKHRYTVSLSIAAFVLGFKLIVDTDLWWHLAAGRWIWENKRPITHDPFSFTAAGLPWMSITWAYELLIYALSESMTAVTAFHALAAAFAIFFAWRTFQLLMKSDEGSGQGESLGAILFALGAWVIQFRWINRPESFTHLFGAAVLFLLVRNWKRQGASDRLIYLIPAIQVAWVNFHGLFAFGPIFVALFLAQDWIGGRKSFKPLAKVLALTILACLVNPRGWSAAVFPLHLLKVLTHGFYRSTIPEAGNPLRDTVWGWDTRGLLIYLAVGLAAVVGWLLLKKDRRALGREHGWGFLVLFVALAALSITARRNISLLVLWTLPWIAALLAEIAVLSKTLPREIHWLGLAAPALLALGAVTNLAYPRDDVFRFGGSRSPHFHPEEAARFLDEKKIPREVFADVGCSSYLLFHLYGFRPYIDGRFAELYPIQHFRRYMDILAHPRLFDEEARARQIQSAVLCHNNPMVKPLVHALAKHPGWKPVFLDEVAVIFVRENVVQSLGLASALEESKNEVARRLSAEHARGSWEIPIREKLNWWQKSVDQLKPLVQLADAAAMLGDIDLSKRALDGAIALNDQFASAWSSLCRISYIKVARDAEKVGKADNKALESVESSCLRSLDLGGDRASGNQVLGLLMLNTQRPRQAVDYFQRVLWTDPLSFEGRFMLAQAYRGVGDADSLAQAKTHLFRAAELRPYEALPVLQLAAIFEKESNLQQALQLYDRAYRIGPSPEVKKKMEEIQGKLGNPSKN